MREGSLDGSRGSDAKCAPDAPVTDNGGSRGCLNAQSIARRHAIPAVRASRSRTERQWHPREFPTSRLWLLTDRVRASLTCRPRRKLNAPAGRRAPTTSVTALTLDSCGTTKALWVDRPRAAHIARPWSMRTSRPSPGLSRPFFDHTHVAARARLPLARGWSYRARGWDLRLGARTRLCETWVWSAVVERCA